MSHRSTATARLLYLALGLLAGGTCAILLHASIPLAVPGRSWLPEPLRLLLTLPGGFSLGIAAWGALLVVVWFLSRWDSAKWEPFSLGAKEPFASETDWHVMLVSSVVLGAGCFLLRLVMWLAGAWPSAEP